MNNLRRGFTLIELLVVIAIIGILASIVLVSLTSARSKARDAQRVSDFTNIKNALHLYYDENDGFIKPSDASSSCGENVDETWSDFNPPTNDCWRALVPAKYIPATPVDPINTSAGVDCSTDTSGVCHTYHYCRRDGGKNFTLAVNLENKLQKTFPAPPGCATSGPNIFWVEN